MSVTFNMKSFTEFNDDLDDIDLEEMLDEGKRGYSAKVKVTVMLLVVRIRALETSIEKERDAVKRHIILAKLSAYSSYLSALAITFDTDDKRTGNRIASYAKKV